MKPPAFDYLAPDDVNGVIEALGELGDDAKIMAGGQSLMAMLNMRLLAPELVIDIGRIDALQVIEARDDVVEIGAGVTQGALARWSGLGRALPLVARALPFVGHVQTRSRGTVCGSIAHADPSSELPLCLAMLEGEVDLRSPRGTRTLSAAVFQEGMLSTACDADELIERVRFPVIPPGHGCGFVEFARRHGDFAIVSAGAVAGPEGTRIGIGGACDRPQVLSLDVTPADEAEAIAAFVESLPVDDTREYPARYRRDLAVALAQRAIEEARA